MAKKHILLQGFGSFPLNFKALIEHARATGDDSIEWSIICTTGHYVETFEKLLGKDAVLYLHSDMKNYLGAPDLLDRLSDYSGNIYRNIESEKCYTKHKKSMRQLRSAAAMYLSMKSFMQERCPTHILFGHIEGLDGMTLISLGRELGIPALVPTHTRHLGESFFSPDHLETLPANRLVTGAHRAKAADFLRRFRDGDTGAAAIPPEIAKGPSETYSFVQPSFFRRTIGVLRRLVNEPEMREPEIFRSSLFINFPALANIFWKTRGALNRRIYDISTPDQLPKRFAYYPLQFTPESSINTPAPYFVDQLRVIDAIRFALRSDMLLVVKEHPSCIGLRPPGFLRSLQKKAGVLIARCDMSSGLIQDRAAITISVTGTSALEALLKGRPALTLGGTFFSSFLDGATGVDSLPQRIREALENPPSDEKILDAVARIYAVSGPFVMGSPLDDGSPSSQYALRKTNIDYFYRHLLQELSSFELPQSVDGHPSVKNFEAWTPSEQSAFLAGLVETECYELTREYPEEVQKYTTFFEGFVAVHEDQGRTSSEGMDRINARLTELNNLAREGKCDLSKLSMRDVVLDIVDDGRHTYLTRTRHDR